MAGLLTRLRARRALRRAGAALAALAAASTLTGAGVLAGAGPAQAVDRLAVQVSGVFQDSSDPTARAATTTTVVGTVATSRLGFVGAPNAYTYAGGQAFHFTAVCATASGGSCATGTVLRWDFGDGAKASTTVGTPNPDDITPAGASTAQDPMVEYHAYTSPGAYAVRVTVDDKTTPAYGVGAIRALVGPRFADVDAAYTATNSSGTVVATKLVNPVSQAVWAVSALGLMPACKPYYSANSASQVNGERPEDPGRALFCPRPGADLVSSGGGALTAATTQPAPRTDFTSDGWAATGASYTSATDCLAAAFNCGLPANAFVANGTPKGSPLAACTSACQAVLANRKVLTAPSGGQLWYDPANCADNRVAVYDPAGSGALTLTRGVEPGCESRGDFLRALLKAVDGTDQDTLASTTGSSSVDGTTCPTGAPNPDPAGRDGVRRATALLSTGGVTVSPCDPDAALTKGEAYRMMAAVLRPTSTSSTTLSLADLDDRTLGYSTPAEPYPYASAVYGVLSAGAPLVGSTLCPATPRNSSTAACFNPYDPLTRLDAAQLLSYFILGDTSDVAAVQVQLTADSTQVNLGGTDQLRLTIAAPSWLLPYQANWSLSLGGGVAASTATFACAKTGARTLTSPSLSLSCPLNVTGMPTGGVLPVVVTVNGKAYPPVNLQVIDAPPTITTVSTPTLTEDGAAANATVGFSSPQSTPIGSLQVADAPAGPWSDLDENAVVDAQSTGVDNSANTGTIALTPLANANGSYTFYARVCDIGNTCSSAQAVTGTVAAVNDPPVAYPVSNVLRTDNVAATTGSCTAAQSGPLPANGFALRGDDPLDAGWSGYTATISSYKVTAPATAFGTLYTCAFNGTWTAVPAGSTVATTGPVVLWNPTVGQYGQATFSYTVVDGGYPGPGLESSPQPITVANSKPGVPPTALLDVDQSSGPAYTTDFTFSGSRSNEGGNTSAIVSYAFDYGDGAKTSAQTSPSVVHRYTAPGTYTVRLTVADAQGLTSTASLTVTVQTNLVGNPTLETGTGQWGPTAAGGVSLTTTATSPHGGLQAGSVARTSGTACQVTHTPPDLVKNTAAGTTYRTTAWVRPTAESTGKQLALTVAETNGTTAVGSLSTTATLGPAGTWQQVPVSYTAAQSGSTLALTLGLPSFTGNACFDFDDVAMTASAPASYSAAVLADSPNAYFKLDETTGTSAASAVGTATGSYAGTYTLGQAPLPTSGSSAAVKVGASDGAVNLSGLSLSTAAGDKTSVEMWVNVPSSPTGMLFGYNSYDLYFSGGYFGFNTACSDVYGVPVSALPAGRHHLVAVFTNGDVTQNRLYIDGTSQSLSRVVAGSGPCSRTASAAAKISGWPNSTAYGATGSVIDEVSVYNYELNPSQVGAHYAAGK